MRINLLNDWISTKGSFDLDNILLMNSDVLTNFDIEQLYLKFIESGSDLTVTKIIELIFHLCSKF